VSIKISIHIIHGKDDHNDKLVLTLMITALNCYQRSIKRPESSLRCAFCTGAFSALSVKRLMSGWCNRNLCCAPVRFVQAPGSDIIIPLSSQQPTPQKSCKWSIMKHISILSFFELKII